MHRVTKAPGARLHYGFDWSSHGWLAQLGDDVTVLEDGGDEPVWTVTERSGTETGDDVALLVDEELVVESKQTWIQLSGGTAGLDYKVSVAINASDGSKDERSFVVRVRER